MATVTLNTTALSSSEIFLPSATSGRIVGRGPHTVTLPDDPAQVHTIQHEPGIASLVSFTVDGAGMSTTRVGSTAYSKGAAPTPSSCTESR
ncbi:MAG: hypothetical protein WAS01_09090 [Nostocoides sp.]